MELEPYGSTNYAITDLDALENAAMRRALAQWAGSPGLEPGGRHNKLLVAVGMLTSDSTGMRPLDAHSVGIVVGALREYGAHGRGCWQTECMLQTIASQSHSYSAQVPNWQRPKRPVAWLPQWPTICKLGSLV